MATASVHDRLGRKELRARKVFWVHHHPFLPVWAEFGAGDSIREVTAYKLETSLFDSDVTWQRLKATWKFRILPSSPVRFVSESKVSDEGGAVHLAELRQDSSAYGRFLGLHPGIVKHFEKWLRDRGIPEDEASTMALKAFTDALDKVVYSPGVRVSVVVVGIMRQRLLNQFRDRDKQGTLVQNRRDVSYELAENALSCEMQVNALFLASRLTRAYAAKILAGATRDEAAGALQLTTAEQSAIEAEIAEQLGVF